MVDREPAIILFDGVCSMCAWSVAFIYRRDPKGRFRFAPLQSPEAASALQAAGHTAPIPSGDDPDSILVIDQGRVFSHSDAALRIARGLRAPWPALTILRIIPRPLRDALYRFIARNRYRWFGRKDACMMPTEELKQRFLSEV